MDDARENGLRALYDAFNNRDLEAVLAAMAPDVDWPNGWEGGRLVGREDVRRYWERQWAEVRQVVRDPAGTVLVRSDVVHVYEFTGPLVQRMRVEQ